MKKTSSKPEVLSGKRNAGPLEKLSFAPENLAENTDLIVVHLDLASESAVPVKSITVTCDGVRENILVQRGKFKIALILYYLWTIINAPTTDTPSFVLTNEMKRLMRDYFGHKLCDSVKADPQTIHKTLRSLLVCKKPLIMLELK